jgi:large subunit ribosomal protein L5
MARLKDIYHAELAPTLAKDLQLKNMMDVPRIEKVVVNMGLGEAVQNIKILESAVEELARISGQKPVVTRAKQSIAQFKLREGMPIGCMVTLRRERAFEFLDRLINVALPRVRDFKGVSPKGFDGRGNYTLGVREQLIFPEIDLEKVDKVKGMNVTIVTSARNDEEGRALLAAIGIPFRKKAEAAEG